MDELFFATHLFKNSNLKDMMKYILLMLLINPFLFWHGNRANAQTISKKSSENTIVFYGNQKKANVISGEYIVFQQSNSKDNQVRGLVFVQNSDVFSCFEANYNPDKKALQKVTFAYPQMGSNGWEKSQSPEDLMLNSFPHELNHNEINESARSLFSQCVNLFSNDRI